MFALTIGTMPVLGIIGGRRLFRIAEQDMSLMARGQMDPSGYALAHGACTVGHAIELVSWTTTALFAALVAMLAFAH